MAETNYDTIVKECVKLLQLFISGDGYETELSFNIGVEFPWGSYSGLKLKKGGKICGKLIKQNLNEFRKRQLQYKHTSSEELYKVAKLIVDGKAIKLRNLSVPSSKSDENDYTSLYILRDYVEIAKYMKECASVNPSSQDRDAISTFELNLAVLDSTVNFYGVESEINLLRNRSNPSPSVKNRLVLTPSYSRYEPNKNTWLGNSDESKNRIWTDYKNVNTIHILVVRPIQVEAYKRNFCQRNFIVASIPENEESAGSARYWCLIIAHALGFKWVFMLDDSFSRTPIRHTPSSDTEKGETVHRGVSILENLQNDLGEQMCENLGILSLRRFNPLNNNAHIVTLCYCQGFQLIHVSSVMERNVNFRRGLYFAEDLLFSQECIDARLATLKLTKVEYYDQNKKTNVIKTSGVHSPNQGIKCHTLLSGQEMLLPEPSVKSDEPTASVMESFSGLSIDDDSNADASA